MSPSSRRLQLDDAALLKQWKPSYKRGFMMQASLAIVGFMFGLTAWLQTGEALWLAGALVLVANWPYTVFGIMPTNRQLDGTAIDQADPVTRNLIEKWARLHATRTALGAVATLIFLWASVR